MHVGVCRLMIHIPYSSSLKEKRQVSRSMVDRIKNQFNVAVAEVDDNDLWQRLTLGISCISNDSAHVDAIISNVLSFVEASRRDVELINYEREIISGV